jgi:NAD-dependent deacetylase
MTDATSRIDALAVRLRQTSRITVLTGAGVSAASGVPTFRGADGLWRRFRPEELATPEAFGRDPNLVWEWYAWRRETIAACRPNAAHDVLARWSRGAGGEWCRIITQNVDDLHLLAGTRDLVRLHGSIWELACAAGCGHPRWRDERVPLPRMPPECPGCGVLARPAVVWFGESLAPDDVDSAMRACACDLFLTVGTSSVVYPAAGFVHEARRRGAFTVEINPEPTAASSAVDLPIHARAEEVLPLLSASWLGD